MRHSKPVRLETAPTGERRCLFIFRIHYIYTSSRHNQPPKSPTPLAPLVRRKRLSGGLIPILIKNTVARFLWRARDREIPLTVGGELGIGRSLSQWVASSGSGDPSHSGAGTRPAPTLCIGTKSFRDGIINQLRRSCLTRLN